MVYGYAKMLEQAGGDERFIKPIIESSQRLDQMLDSLSFIGRVAAQRVTPKLSTVAVGPLLEAFETAKSGEKDILVVADPDWLKKAIDAIQSELQVLDTGLKQINITTNEIDALIYFETVEGSFVPEITLEKSRITMALAVMITAAMEGTILRDDQGLTLRLPLALK